MKCLSNKDGIVKEHISTRQSAGFFDVSHMGQLFISGETNHPKKFGKNYSFRF